MRLKRYRVGAFADTLLRRQGAAATTLIVHVSGIAARFPQSFVAPPPFWTLLQIEDLLQKRDNPGGWREVLLGQRDADVLILVIGNKSNKEICMILSLSAGTVAVYLNRLYAGLPVTNRGELKDWGKQHREALGQHGKARQWVEQSLHEVGGLNDDGTEKPACQCERCFNVEVAELSDGGRPPDKLSTAA
jgi:DNA-binding CsgD family transcriptional regulator